MLHINKKITLFQVRAICYSSALVKNKSLITINHLLYTTISFLVDNLQTSLLLLLPAANSSLESRTFTPAEPT